MTTATWSAIHLGTIADIDTDESVLGIENPGALIRTWGGPTDPLFHRVTEILTDTDEDPNIEVDSEQTGALDTVSYDIGAGPVTTQIDAGAAVSGVITFHDGTTYSSTFAVMQDQTGALFLLISDTDPTLASKAIDSLQVTSVVKSDYVGLVQLSRDELSFVCFTDGARILTPEGERAVEHLLPGDLVVTADRGAQPIRWIGRRMVLLTRGDAPDRPVRIAAGALGAGAPRRSLLVSPRHRVLLRAPPQGGAAQERLCAALFLDGAPGIARCAEARLVRYHALLMDRHEVLFAEGAQVESFYPGPYALRMMGASLREEILAAAPRLCGQGEGYGPLARPDMKRREARALLEAGGPLRTCAAAEAG